MFGLTTNEIKVTDAARAHLKRVVTNELAGLRLMILDGKGCGGHKYDLRPVKTGEVEAGDEQLKVDEGLTLFIPAMNVLNLFGSTIDYIEDAVGNKKIEITNPNEKGRCGCGLSVSF